MKTQLEIAKSIELSCKGSNSAELQIKLNSAPGKKSYSCLTLINRRNKGSEISIP